MKTYNLYFFFLVSFLITTIQAKAQWVAQNGNLPYPAGIDGLCIVDANVVWGIGYVGLNPPYNARYYTRTIDGGNNWKSDTIKATPSVPPDQGIENLIAISADTAWTITYSPAQTTAGGIYKTIDGGTSWVAQTSASFNVNSYPEFIYFWDKNNGVALGDPNPSVFEIYTTSNGGANWLPVPSASIPPPLAGELGYYTFSVIGSTIWTGTTAGRMLKSTDMGLHWTASTVIANKPVNKPVFKDLNNGLCQIGQNNDTLMRTNDGGATWNIVPYTGKYLMGDLCYASGANPFYICTGSLPGCYGSSYSTDDGVSWTSIDVVVRHFCLAFLNSSVGWSGSVIMSGSPTTEGIYKWTGINGIKEYQNLLGLKLYPNPNNGLFHITQENSTDDRIQISVSDIVGKLAYNTSLTSNVSGLDMDLTSQPKGLYFVRVTNSKGESGVKKLVIE